MLEKPFIKEEKIVEFKENNLRAFHNVFFGKTLVAIF